MGITLGQVAGGMGAEEVASLGVVAAKQVLEGRAEGLVVVSMDLGVGEGMLGLVAVCMVLVGAVGLAEVGMAVQGTAVEEALLVVGGAEVAPVATEWGGVMAGVVGVVAREEIDRHTQIQVVCQRMPIPLTQKTS